MTNVILKVACGDEDQLSILNELFQDGVGFISCDSKSLPRGWYAGTKVLQCEICVGAFNHLRGVDLIEAIQKVPWKYPRSVQLFTQGEEEERMEEVELTLSRD